MNETPSRDNVGEMFDTIAPSYDMGNHLLSFGLDLVWRHRVAKKVDEVRAKQVLDLATGTGDLALMIQHESSWVEKIVGIDISRGMLDRAIKKVEDMHLEELVDMREGDAEDLKLEDESFDAVTIAFGIRNVKNTSRALREMWRILRPGGHAYILEFSIPSSKLIRFVHLTYLRYIMPIFGGLISGNKHAYRYLNKTIETFPYGDNFVSLMKDAGFRDVKFTPMTFGSVTLYEAVK